jgi:hypothetical protein
MPRQSDPHHRTHVLVTARRVAKTDAATFAYISGICFVGASLFRLLEPDRRLAVVFECAMLAAARRRTVICRTENGERFGWLDSLKGS